MIKKTLCTIFCGCMISIAAFAQNNERIVSERGIPNYKPTQENLQAQEAFRDMKFGVFIHWGVYSMLARGEWVMETSQIEWQEYEKMASAFYPHLFNADEWVSQIKASGAKYITITSRHHDGFSMYGTKMSNFNIVDATPFGRDVLKELAEACQKQGIMLNFYYSLLDWRRDDYPRGLNGTHAGRAGVADPENYFKFMKGQIRELLTNYGPIGCIWFDGHWDHGQDPYFDWHYDEIYALIHELQPACLVGNNHHIDPIEGEDIQIFERDVPGANTAGWHKGAVSKLPLETCDTMNGMWGYKIEDQNYKSVKQILRYLISTAGRNANLLLNVGPQPNGQIPAAAVERFKAVGEWMNTYGETIYGTRSELLPPQEWGVVTEKGNKVYVHLFPDDLVKTRFVNPSQGGEGEFFLPIPGIKVKNVKIFGGNPVKFKVNEAGVRMFLGEVPVDVADYIVEIELSDSKK